jgi:glycosyltransferase involved in cell wall biosynthesis
VPTLVSVVLPTYNRAETLPRAVSSVLAQSYPALELIIVDDGSTDRTPDLLASMDDGRVRYLRLDGRSGPATARNAGIAAAAGDLVAFQDSDDEWLPTKLSAQVSMIEAGGPEVGWVGGRHRIVLGAEIQEVGPELVIAGIDHLPDLLDGRAFVTPTWLVRRETLERTGLFREDMPCLEDWDLIFRLDDGCQFRAVDEIVLTRYGSADSLFGHDPSRAAGMEMMMAMHGHRWRNHPSHQAARYRDLGAVQARLGQRRRALRSYAKAVRLDPFRWRSYPQLARSVLR